MNLQDYIREIENSILLGIQLRNHRQQMGIICLKGKNLKVDGTVVRFVNEIPGKLQPIPSLAIILALSDLQILMRIINQSTIE